MVRIGSGLAPIEEEAPRPRVRTPRVQPQDMDAQEKNDLVFAIDTWIRAYTKAARNHPDGQTARTMRRMELLKQKYDSQ